MLTRPVGEVTSSSAIAAEFSGSSSYVSKVLQELVRAGILGSRKGAQGGFYFVRPPHEITLWDVISPFGEFDSTVCAMDGARACVGTPVCGLHDYWDKIRSEITRKLKSTTLLDLYRRRVPTEIA